MFGEGIVMRLLLPTSELERAAGGELRRCQVGCGWQQTQYNIGDIKEFLGRTFDEERAAKNTAALGSFLMLPSPG